MSPPAVEPRSQPWQFSLKGLFVVVGICGALVYLLDAYGWFAGAALTSLCIMMAGIRYHSRGFRIIGFLSGFVLTVLFGLSVGARRSSFSPDTLQSRWQEEWLVGDSAIYRSRFDYYRYELVDYLVDKGYWSPRETTMPVWLFMNHSSTAWRDGHAPLYSELVRHREGWIRWTEDHPDLAAVVWPQVLDLLRRRGERGGSEAAEVLWHAKGCTQVAEFNARLNSDPELQSLNLGQ